MPAETRSLAIRPHVLEGEVVGNGLFLEANPFRLGSFQWVEVKEDATLAEFYEAAAGELAPAYRPHIELFIDEHRIERSYWPQVKPKLGVTVYARVRPHGGRTGKNILRAFLMIAIVVAATYFLGPGAFAAGGWLGLSLSAGAAAIASAVAVAVVTTIGMLAVNALIPAPGLTGDNSRKDPKYQLTGSSNQFAPYNPIPRPFGRLRIFPIIAGHPYTEVVGNKQYLRMLLLCGWGPLKISDIKIGETPLSAFKNVEIEITEGGPAGWGGNVPITLYNRRVIELPLSIQLTQAGGASVLQTTALNTVEISCDLTFPFGLIHIKKDGTRQNRSVVVRVEYRAVGSGTWLTAPLESAYTDANQSVSGGNITVSSASQDAVRATARFKVANGQYEVRLTRTTSDAVNGSSGDQDLDGTFWTTLRSFSADAPVLQDGVCLIALRMQASDQLNGTPQQINCLVESYLPVYGIGVELVTNGDGTSASGWTNGGGATASAVGGNLRITNGGSANGYAYQSFTTVVGHRYLLQYDKFGGSTVARVMVGNSAASGAIYDDTAAGTIPNNSTTFVATATTTYLTLMCQGGAGANNEFDNISMKDLDANAIWSYQITRSPAWAFADILRRRGPQSMIPDSRIDIAALQAWNADASKVAPNAPEPRWTFDGVIEGGTVFDALRTIAAAGRAAYTMRDGKFSVVQDKAQATPVQLITPKNSWGYSATRTYLDQPHALRVEFQNKDLEYQNDELIVYNDGYTSANATLFEVLPLIGCTSPKLAFREARYHMAVAKLRPEEHRISMDIEGLRCTLGDRVQLSYDVMDVGKTWGRIAGITTAAGNTVAVTVDEDCIFETAVTYQLRVRKADGSISVRTVTMTGGPGTTRVLNFPSPETTSTGPQAGDLYVFGETGIETAPMIVKRIEPGDELSVVLTLANYDANIYTADTGTIPAFTSYLNTDPTRTPPANPTVKLRADETVRVLTANGGRSAVWQLGVDIYNPSNRIAVQGNEVQYRDLNDTLWSNATANELHGLNETTVYVAPILLGHTYQVRVRAKGWNGLYSDWVQPANITAGATTVLPSPPTSVQAVGGYRSVLITFVPPNELDFSTVNILASTTNSSGSAVVVGSDPTGSFTHQNLSGGVTWYYFLRSVDQAGNFSAFTSVVSAVPQDGAGGGDNVVYDPGFTGGSNDFATPGPDGWSDGGGRWLRLPTP